MVRMPMLCLHSHSDHIITGAKTHTLRRSCHAPLRPSNAPCAAQDSEEAQRGVVSDGRIVTSVAGGVVLPGSRQGPWRHPWWRCALPTPARPAGRSAGPCRL
jgi:hypothetical protein